MTALDMVVLALAGGFGALGFLRGFVKEAMTLVAWVAAVLAVKLGFTPVAGALEPRVGTASGAAVLAFILLFGVTLLGGKFLASSLGRHSRQSVLGPFDRVLGAGFGMFKGLILATLLFLLLSAGTSLVSSGTGPSWLTAARTYPLLKASSGALVDLTRHGRHDERAVQP